MSAPVQIDETLVRNVVQQVLARLGPAAGAAAASNGRQGRSRTVHLGRRRRGRRRARPSTASPP